MRWVFVVGIVGLGAGCAVTGKGVEAEVGADKTPSVQSVGSGQSVASGFAPVTPHAFCGRMGDDGEVAPLLLMDAERKPGDAARTAEGPTIRRLGGSREPDTVTRCSGVILDITPARWGWVDGIEEGMSVEYVHSGSAYETRPISRVQRVDRYTTFLADPGSVRGASPYLCERYLVVADTQVIVRTPAGTVERVVPYVHRDGRTYRPVTEPEVSESGSDCQESTEPQLFEGAGVTGSLDRVLEATGR